MIKVSEEYVIYEFINMVASIGGTLGLFIGFSFTNLTSGLIILMKKMVNSGRQEERVIHFTEDMLLQFKETQKAMRKMEMQIRDIQRNNGAMDLTLQNID